MITFDKVSKHYRNGHTALSNVSFHLKKQEMTFLTGHSGAGKSTLLKLIMCIEGNYQGKIVYQDKDISRLGRRKIPFLRRSIGMIFQDPMLLAEKSVYDNVALPLIVDGYRYQEVGRRVRPALDMVGLLGKEKLLPGDLSQGERQRVGIARAIVNRPVLILADEPTGNLDPELSLSIMRLFDNFRQTGATVLVATHDLSLIATMSHPVITLKNGRIVKESGEHHE